MADQSTVPVLSAETPEHAALGQDRLQRITKAKPFLDTLKNIILPTRQQASTPVFNSTAKETQDLNDDDYRAYVEKLKNADSHGAQYESTRFQRMRPEDNELNTKGLMTALAADEDIVRRGAAKVAETFGHKFQAGSKYESPLFGTTDTPQMSIDELLDSRAPGVKRTLLEKFDRWGWNDDAKWFFLGAPAFALGMVFDPLNLASPAARTAKGAAASVKAATKAGGKASAKGAERSLAGEATAASAQVAKDSETALAQLDAQHSPNPAVQERTPEAGQPAPVDLPAADAPSEIVKQFAESGGTGFTYNTKRGVLAEDAPDEWAVSIFPEREVTIEGRGITPDDVRQFMEQNDDVLSDPRVSVGLWKDDNGAVHIEPSYTTRSKPQAEALGRQFDQQAIFSQKSGVVQLGGSGKPNLAALPSIEDRLGSEAKVGLVDEFPNGTPLASQFDITAAPAVDALRRANQGVEIPAATVTKHLKVAGAAAIYRGAQSVSAFKKALTPDLPPSVLETMTEKKWASLFDQSKTRYKQIVEKWDVGGIPSVQRVRQMFEQHEYNKAWYSDWKPTVESMFGTEPYTLPSGVVTNDAEMFTRFFAATSPRTGVERAAATPGESNVDRAVKAFVEWKTGEPFSTAFEGHKLNLERAAEGIPFSEGSPKVQSFYLNLWGDPYAVTADGRMANVFGFSPDNMTSGKYQFVQEVVRQEARRAGVTPAEYQAPLWTADKVLTEPETMGIPRDVVDSLRSELQRIVDADPTTFAALHNWQQILDAANIRKPGFLDGQAFTMPLSNAAKFSTLTDSMKQTAARYHAAPEFDDAAVPLWKALAKEVDQRYAELEQKYTFIPVKTDTPYHTAQEMFDDLAQGKLKVSTLNNEHPVFTPEENFRFRAVHDVLGHQEGRADFTMAGEERAFNTQSWAHSAEAKQALEVEVMGQATAAIDKGGFQTQKVFLPTHEYAPGAPLTSALKSQAGHASMPAALFLARLFAGASAGMMAGDEEHKLRNALVGAGLGAFATPTLLTKVAKALQAQKAVPDKTPFLATAEGQRVATSARYEKALPLDQMALDYQRTLKETIGDTRHWKDVLEESDLLANYGMITPDFLRAMQPGKVLNDAEIGAAAIVQSRSYTQLRNLADQLVQNPHNPDFQLEFVKQLVGHGMADIGRLSGTTEAGRSLAIHKALEPKTAYLDQVSDLISRLKAGQGPARIAELLLREPDPMATLIAARVAAKPGFSDMILEAWTLGLVASVKTFVVNIAGNSLFTAMGVAERKAARLYGSGVAPGESGAMLQGMMASFNESLKAGWLMMKNFEDLHTTNPELLAKYDIGEKAITAENAQDLYLSRKLGVHLFNDKNEPNILGRAVNFIGTAIRIPARGLVGPDVFFRGINMQAELFAQARREAHAESVSAGVSGAEYTKAVERNYMKLLANPPDALLRASKDFATYSVFQKDLGPFGQALQKLASSTLVAKFILPFVKTPGNLLKAAGERSPLALITKDFREAIKRGGADAELAMTKMATGSMMMAFFSMLAGAGVITGSLPSNPAARKIDMDNGMSPGSLNLTKLQRIVSGTDDGSALPQKGDYFVEIDRMDPVGMHLLMAADYTRISGELSDADREDLALALGAATAKAVASRSWIKGATEVAMGVSDPDRYGQRVLQRFAGTFVPFSGLANSVTRQIDPTVREAQSVLDEMKKKVWPFSESVIPGRDLFGKVVQYPPGVGPDLASPLPESTYKDHPVLTALRTDDVPIEVPRDTFPVGDGRSVPLQPAELDRYRVLAGHDIKDAFGRNYEEAMLAVIKTAKDLQRTTGPDSWRAARFREVTNEFRAKARTQLMAEFPDLKRAAQESQLDLRRAQGKPIFDASQLGVQ